MASVEALDEAVGLRPEGLCQAMLDTAALAEPVEGMAAGGLAGRFVPGVDRAAVGELAAIVGEDGVDGLREVVEEALDDGDGRGRIALGMKISMYT